MTFARSPSWRAALILALAVYAAPALAGDDAAVTQALALQLAEIGQTRAAAEMGDAAGLQRFYALTQGRPAWRRDGRWSAESQSALAALRAADSEGLNPRDYLAAGIAPLPETAAPEETARRDLLLSAGMLRYIGDVRAGRVVPSTVDSDYAVYPARPDAASVLAKGLHAEDFAAWLRTLPPQDADYRRLRDALAAQRKLAAGEPWPQLAAGPTLRAGATGPEIGIVRQQLSRLGDLPQIAEGSGEFDEGLEVAVRHFQRRNGLEPDAAVGAHTRAALNVTPRERIATIALNLERLRWFERPASGRYVIVNTAGFELTAVADGKVAAKMPIVVGKADWRTPVFHDDITAVTFMPSWTVPPNIARRELLPKIRRDPEYLAKHDMKVYSGWDSNACEVDPSDVDWKSLRPGELEHRFVQQPGPANPLGRIRFTLHNEFGVFLHDTPTKSLFGKEIRAYSHGCVRVGDAPALAVFAFNGDPEWPPAAIEAAMNGGETKTVELREPVATEVTYLTAWVDEQGVIQFRRDVYGRDPALARALRPGEGY